MSKRRPITVMVRVITIVHTHVTVLKAVETTYVTVSSSSVNPLESRGSYSATSNNMKLVHSLLMGRLLHLVQRKGGPSLPRPLLAVPNVTAHPSTANVPITVLIITIITTMFMVVSSWHSHCESSPNSFDECRMAPSGRRPKTKPDDLGCESACTGCQKLHPPSHFMIITQPES